MRFLNKYPYTDFHELNLDWLITTYNDIVDEINTINTWVSQHKIEYEEAIAELQRVANEIDTFEAQINAEFERLKEDQQKQLDDAISAINVEVDDKIRQMTEEVQTAINNINAQFEQLRLLIANELTTFKSQINREISDIRNSIGANNELIFEWVENRLQEFIDSFPEIVTVYIYNPYRGEVTDIQQAVNDLYTVACIWGMTAFQYDSLGLTASEYDAKEMTALEYDTLGYKLMYPDPDLYMMSPFTGTITPVKDVVLRLCYFHMEGLTAEEYDLKELTAEDYDALEITAFDYDWFGEQIIA